MSRGKKGLLHCKNHATHNSPLISFLICGLLTVENMIASHLLKFCHFMEDAHGYRMKLMFLRDVDKREVDFLVTCDRKPWMAVEAKLSDGSLHKPLDYFRTRLKIPFCYQVVMNGKKDIMKESIRIMPAVKFLSGLM